MTESLWQEPEQHLRAFKQLARRTVEEAWLAGDALMCIKEQLPHGAWTLALEERMIAVRSGRRFIQLRKQYPQIGQFGRFDSETAALTDKKSDKSGADTPIKTAPVGAYLVSADDLWAWERGEVSTLARRLLTEEELQEFSDNVTGEIRFLTDSFEIGELLSEVLYLMRRKLSCYVNIGPLEEDAPAIEETKRRLAILSESVDQLIDGAKSTQNREGEKDERL